MRVRAGAAPHSFPRQDVSSLEPSRAGDRLAWPPAIGVRTEGGGVLALDTCQVLADELIWALRLCLTWVLPGKGTLSSSIVIHTLCCLFLCFVNRDIFSFLSLVLFQPHALLTSWSRAVIVQCPGGPSSDCAGVGPLAVSYSPPC